MVQQNVHAMNLTIATKNANISYHRKQTKV